TVQLGDLGLSVAAPAGWRHEQVRVGLHRFRGPEGSLMVSMDGLHRYVPSDAQLAVRAALPAGTRIEQEGPCWVCGWPAYQAAGVAAPRGSYSNATAVVQGIRLYRLEVSGPASRRAFLEALAGRERAEMRL